MRHPLWLLLASLASLGWGSLSVAKPVVVGIDQAFPPHQYLDDEGRPAGFDLEIFQAIAEVQGIAYQVRSGPWHEIRRQLEAGEIDVSPGMVRSPERETRLDFSVPVILESYAVFVRDDSPVNEIADLRGSVVAVEHSGIWEDRILERRYAVQVDAEASPAEALRRLAEGRADAAVLGRKQGLFLLRHLGLDGIRSLGTSEATMAIGETVAFRLAVPAGRTALLASLNDGLAVIRANGRHDEIYDRWFGVLDTPFWKRPLGRGLTALTLLALLGCFAFLLWSRALQRRVAERTRDLVVAESDRRALQEQLLHAQKMDALGRLAAGVAHDFNNVLSVVLGGVATAREAVAEGEPAARALGAAQNAARSARELVQQLLAFSRRQDTKPEPLNWNDLLLEQGEMLRRLIGPGMRLEMSLAPKLPQVVLDRSQASQVVLNLVVNARDAMQGSGINRIETRKLEVDGRSVVRLTVRDQGPGMDAETRQRIFEPFFTTKGEQGAGLGLSTVFGIVTQNGGSLHVESELGKGSSFHVDLPAARQVGPGPRTASGAPAGRRRVRVGSRTSHPFGTRRLRG